MYTTLVSTTGLSFTSYNLTSLEINNNNSNSNKSQDTVPLIAVDVTYLQVPLCTRPWTAATYGLGGIFPDPSSPKRRYLDLALSLSAAFAFSFDPEDRERERGRGDSCCMGWTDALEREVHYCKTFLFPLILPPPNFKPNFLLGFHPLWQWLKMKEAFSPCRSKSSIPFHSVLFCPALFSSTAFYCVCNDPRNGTTLRASNRPSPLLLLQIKIILQAYEKWYANN